MTRIADLLDRDFSGPVEEIVKVNNYEPDRADLSSADIREAACRVLRKKKSQESILRELFRDCGPSLVRNVRLERCSRRTEFDEDRFVRFYPYLPHLIDLSIEIVAGIRVHPGALKHLDWCDRTIVRQTIEMLVSDRTRLADQPIGVLVSIDKIYELLEGSIPPEKQKDVIDIRRRFDDDKDYPEMAARVAKAICLMEFVKTDLPRTTNNIAALLVRRATEAPPADAVAALLEHMNEARFVYEAEDGWKFDDLDELRRASVVLSGLKFVVGTVNPRLPGWHNHLIQVGKKSLARVLSWYTRPQHKFNASVSHSLGEIIRAFDRLSTNLVTPEQLSTSIAALDRLSIDVVALEGRLKLSEKRAATREESMQVQLELMHEQIRALAGLQKTGNPEAHADRIETNRDRPARENSQSCIDAGPGNDRTTYVIGLFGSGRRYVNELLLRNIGPRAHYFRDTIRLHPGPTPMIYSGHATMKYDSRLQYPPAITSRILEAVSAGFADLIFVYRHPLDSLLTNWVWWRTYIRDNRWISGISQIYENTDDLCVDLERYFPEFEAFAEGNPGFFSSAPGPRFLSFREFVEETYLHVQSATLALRLEDFMMDPLKEFSRIVEIMCVDLDLGGLCPAPPRTTPYGYLAVRDKVPRFRSFIGGLDAETNKRIEEIGYNAGI